MRAKVLVFFTLCTALWWPITSHGANPGRGRALYENHCLECHESRVHITEKRKAKTLVQIRTAIWRWMAEKELEWTEEEVTDVLHYLNARYYKY